MRPFEAHEIENIYDMDKLLTGKLAELLPVTPVQKRKLEDVPYDDRVGAIIIMKILGHFSRLTVDVQTKMLVAVVFMAVCDSIGLTNMSQFPKSTVDLVYRGRN